MKHLGVKVKKLVALKLSGMMMRIGRIRNRRISTQMPRKVQYQMRWPVEA